MKASKEAASRTQFYDLLGVESSATDKDLKKAYRKKALQLHPDKQGGDGEPFKKMKYAYDVLSDPNKRQAYDKYGEPGVQLIEGNLSPEVAAKLFLNIGPCERLLLIFLLTLVIGYLLLFPILLSIRWDHPKSMTFAHVFLPTWIGLAFVLMFCLCCFTTPEFPEPEEEDEHSRKEIEEDQQKQLKQHYAIRFGGISVVVVLSLLLFFLVLRLDGETNWSYFLVIWPWILLEIGWILYAAYTADLAFVVMGHDPAILKEKKWLNQEWICFVIMLEYSHICKIIFACLIAYKMDGYPWTWWEVFIPLWVEYVIGTIMDLCHCCSGRLKSAEELGAMPFEARAREETAGTIFCKLVGRSIWLGCLVLLCLKLEKRSAFPAWIIFLPIFVFAGCFCCCLSCFLCCMSSDVVPDGAWPDDEEAGRGAPPAYGTMK